jgi:hypothetical protein
MHRASYDVLIVLLNVHGGSYHCAFRLLERLGQAGLSCAALLATDPTRGLQVGLDVQEEDVRRLAGLDIHVLPRAKIRAVLADVPGRLVLFDSFRDEETPQLAARVRERHTARTGQLAALLADFSYAGVDHAFVQHPLTLWFELEYARTSGARNLVRARGIHFCGNIFHEPVCNTWTSTIRTREDFCAKYGLDPQKPIGLWLPDREDGQSPAYGQVLEAVRAAGLNVAVKMHPWEYKMLGHGFDHYGTGRTSAQIWGVPAVEERDRSWAFFFCDVAVTRGSTVSLELPFWGKPGIHIPPEGKYRRVVRGLIRLVGTCSLRRNSTAGLAEVLARHREFGFGAAEYRAARANVVTDPDRDAFEQHLERILEILERPTDPPAVGSLAPVRRLYRGTVPLGLLKPRHFPAEIAARLARLFT